MLHFSYSFAIHQDRFHKLIIEKSCFRWSHYSHSDFELFAHCTPPELYEIAIPDDSDDYSDHHCHQV
jgi:hypothetical protein